MYVIPVFYSVSFSSYDSTLGLSMTQSSITTKTLLELHACSKYFKSLSTEMNHCHQTCTLSIAFTCFSCSCWSKWPPFRDISAIDSDVYIFPSRVRLWVVRQMHAELSVLQPEHSFRVLVSQASGTFPQRNLLKASFFCCMMSMKSNNDEICSWTFPSCVPSFSCPKIGLALIVAAMIEPRVKNPLLMQQLLRLTTPLRASHLDSKLHSH